MATTRRNAGVLAPQVEGYRAWLTGRGYAPETIRNMLKDLSQSGCGFPPKVWRRHSSTRMRWRRSCRPGEWLAV